MRQEHVVQPPLPHHLRRILLEVRLHHQEDPKGHLGGLTDDLHGGHLGYDGIGSLVEPFDERVMIGHALTLWEAHQVMELMP